jgi:hypothetical protein
MGLFKPKPPPNTISDAKWKGIQARAVEANPELNQLWHPRAIARRKLASRNHDNRTQN